MGKFYWLSSATKFYGTDLDLCPLSRFRPTHQYLLCLFLGIDFGDFVYIRISNALFGIAVSLLTSWHTVAGVQIQKCKYNYINYTHCNNNILERSQTSPSKRHRCLEHHDESYSTLQNWRMKSTGSHKFYNCCAKNRRAGLQNECLIF